MTVSPAPASWEDGAAQPCASDVDAKRCGQPDQSLAFTAVLLPDGTVTATSAAALDTAQAASQAGAQGKKFWERDGWTAGSLHLEQELRSACEHAARGVSSRREIELPSGVERTKTLDLSITPVRDAQGQIVHLVALALDITDRKQAEAEQRQVECALAASRADRLEMQLREADRRKHAFLATLAHELRNPLAPIQHVSTLLQLPGLSEERRQWGYQVLDRQVRHLARLLDDLLDIARITRGSLTLRKKLVDLETAVAAALEVARPLIDAHHHHLLVELPDTPVKLQADPVRLAQIIANLLTNAAKYTDNGGQIELRARVEQRQLVLSVRDTGIGLTADALSKMFEMFSQVRPEMERADGGLGVGLSIVRELVELHEGRVEACSEGPGRGSEIIVRLPLREQPSQHKYQCQSYYS